ncbi:MAG: phosphoribosylformylglycinamidine synthase [Lachnospiraceae bacterium]|nr:phosphoribosylformylglycinamidine synthase [Lachnospiraceae bacterium]
MVYRIYVEKKNEYAQEAAGLQSECINLLGVEGLKYVRVLNRYDAENMEEDIFNMAVKTVFSEPQTDLTFSTLDDVLKGCCKGSCSCGEPTVFAVEYLPGQFNQRADSAAQCIQFISKGERADIASAKVYVLYGTISEEELAAIKKHVINPVEAREASLELPETIKAVYDIPTEVEVLTGFNDLDKEGLEDFVKANGLAMDVDDLLFCQNYFKSEGKAPTITEIKVIDTYWSDHCRHTTFNTIIDDVTFEDEELQKAFEGYLDVRKELNREKPVCLFDIGTLAAKYLRQKGMLDKLDESEEINACTVKIEVEADGVKEPWLLLFKNETHNHPTEIEPFGGAATCIGGAIRDPLSGRSYVYAAMRVTGAADPRTPIAETMQGKLPQRTLVTNAAHGYSSYGNQIGLTTGIVDELYHPGYAAKHMEVGAVIAAAPAENVRRERPEEGDVVILLGGSTGRDGIGGATGSSKAHDAHSVETCGAEVQKGNAPEERKLQRLFRNKEASQMIKRCNDFGAGGVSVAIGELADGLLINLNAVPKKYEGLDGTELAISESQERMAVVVEGKDLERFLQLAEEENLQAVKVADVTADPRLVLQWNGKDIVNISRAFLDTNGAEKHITVSVPKAEPIVCCAGGKTCGGEACCGADSAENCCDEASGKFAENMKAVASDINVASKRGLSEMFDSTIGAGSVLMPFGGKYQRTPIQAMVHKISMEKKHTDDCSVMSWGYNPMLTSKSPFHGAYLSVVESVCKLVAAGAKYEDVYLSFQEYFEKLGHDPKRWGVPFAAVLGAFKAQVELGVAAIGGKDSMSGTFEDLDVPPTLISFAVTTDKCENIVSPEFKQAGNKVLWVVPNISSDGILPCPYSLKKIFKVVPDILRNYGGVSAYTPTYGGVAEAVLKMSLGNQLGFNFAEGISLADIFGCSYGSFLLEVPADCDPEQALATIRKEVEKELGERSFGYEAMTIKVLGEITGDFAFTYKGEKLCGCEVSKIYEDVLEDIYPCNNVKTSEGEIAIPEFGGKAEVAAPAILNARPKVMITAFPGTNCEYDSAKAVADAGAEPEIVVINNLTTEGIARSIEKVANTIKESQMIFLPGGFSGGDEPDGSAKFITAFFRNDMVKDAVADLIDKRGGLMCGICNGFQALIKLGLVPFGKIIDTDETCPTLTFNTIARHQSKIVRTKIVSTKSPWLSLMNVGDIVNVPISHGEGRFIASDELIAKLAANGQIATQYVDLDGNPTYDVAFNPNNSNCAIEGITSPDGRIFGKMGHSERKGSYLYKNVPGEYENHMFEAAVKFFK